MKRVYLLRHAKSSWQSPGLTDFERPLSPRGLQAASEIGTFINEYGAPDYCICSSAKRTIETLEKVLEQIPQGVEFDLSTDLYLAASDMYLKKIRQLDGRYKTVLIIGHNYGIEDAVNELGCANTEMKTASLAVIDFPVDEWSSVKMGELILMHRPSK